MRPNHRLRAAALAALLVVTPLAPAVRADEGDDPTAETGAGVLYAINCGMSLRLVRHNPVFFAMAVANCALMVIDALGDPDPK